MPEISAGLLLYRLKGREVEVFLVHPGGPFWAAKDLGVWSIPKGLVEGKEDLLATAMREFKEETGFTASAPFIPLTPVKLRSGKIVHAWAGEGDYDPALMRSNLFTIEWPPGSGRRREYPEADRGAWFTLEDAKQRISTGQQGFLEELAKLLFGNP